MRSLRPGTNAPKTKQLMPNMLPSQQQQMQNGNMPSNMPGSVKNITPKPPSGGPKPVRLPGASQSIYKSLPSEVTHVQPALPGAKQLYRLPPGMEPPKALNASKVDIIKKLIRRM